jgi:phosphonate degradation associated HDIG domain protein
VGVKAVRDPVIDEIARLFAERGGALYFGEAVSEAEHALQAAAAAERDGASNAQIAAALLHDIGHLMHDLGEDVARRGIDARHEDVGADWLARHFGPDVAEPVRLHVPAKRYLCAVEPGYLDGLSPASRESLRLQGGPFTAEEAAEFARHPYARRAAALRRWDDEAKVPDLVTPNFDYFRQYLEAARAGA